MTAPLIWVGAAALAAARPGTGLSIGGEEARHAVAVKRLRPGEDVLLSDAAGRLARAAVTRVVPGQAPELGVLVRDVEDVPAPVPALALVQALTKQRRDEAAVAAATGLGVDAIIPWQSDRSVVRWLDGGREDRPDRPGKAGRGRERWQQLALAEAKVARRPRVPSVAPVVDSKGLFRRLRQAVIDDGSVVVTLHEEAGAGLAAALAPALEAGPVPAVYLIAGPEGGISPAELEQLAQVGAAAARLGPEVLRAGLAGPAALAVASHLLGRWA